MGGQLKVFVSPVGLYYSSHMFASGLCVCRGCSQGHSSVQGGPGAERASVELL